jgi:flagellin
MTVINTNIKSLVAQDANRAIGLSQATSMQRLSTGLRVNSAKDDAAGLSIGTRMEAQTRGLSMAIRNANDGISLMQTAEGSLQEVTNSLQRMRELAVQAANGVNNASDRSALDKEVQQLKTEIDRIATKTQFNNINILDGSFQDKKLQIGDKADQTMRIDIASAKVKDLGVGGSSGSGDVMIGARLQDNAASGSRAAAISTDFADPISGLSLVINGHVIQAIDKAASGVSDGSTDINDIVSAINHSNAGVKASAFNEVVAKNTGTGVLAAGNLVITVTQVDTGKDLGVTVGKTNSMKEVVDQINAMGSEGAVQARINDDGKLVLFNTTGAKIKVNDASGTTDAFDTNTGFKDGDITYEGMLKLESTSGDPISIGTDALARGKTVEDQRTALATLGLQANTSNQVGSSARSDSYSVVGGTVSAIATKWEKGELSINGVNIWRDGQETDGSSFAHVGATSGTGYTDAAALAWVQKIDLINSFAAETGVTAEKFTNADGGSVLKLNSINSTPISIALGDASSTVNAYGKYASHGLMEQNVGAADYDTNAPTGGTGAGGSALTGTNVMTVEAAGQAITAIDKAIEKVSDMRADLGAKQNRLNSTVNNLTNVVTNTEASKSRIMDTDYGKETTNLARAQIISQAATAMLAQANQSAQSVLSLLK